MNADALGPEESKEEALVFQGPVVLAGRKGATQGKSPVSQLGGQVAVKGVAQFQEGHRPQGIQEKGAEKLALPVPPTAMDFQARADGVDGQGEPAGRGNGAA